MTLLWLALGCASHAEAGPAGDQPLVEKTAVSTDNATVEGPALSPSKELLSWLDGEGTGKRIQLPVTVSRSVLGVTGGTLGTADDALELKLDDGAMGVSLAERLSEQCGSNDDPCAVWLEGIWGTTVPMPSFGAPSDSHPFSVRRLVGPIDEPPSHIRVVE